MLLTGELHPDPVHPGGSTNSGLLPYSVYFEAVRPTPIIPEVRML
jgi:hypothetical protein